MAKLAPKEGICYCLLTMLLFMLLTVLLTANLLNGANSAKSSFRRSLVVEDTVEEGNKQIEEANITLIDLGKKKVGLYIPTKEGHDIVIRETSEEEEPELNIGFIICRGNVTNYVTISNLFIASVKSIMLFTAKPVVFRIISNDVEAVNSLIKTAFPARPKTFRFDIRPDMTSEDLTSLKDTLRFKGCGHLKVTFYQTFSDLDNLLLLDLDTILLRPVEELFAHLGKFGKTAVMGMAEEHPWNPDGYYSHRPYAHNPAGLNGGLLLYNFTRIRTHTFASPNNLEQTASFSNALTDAIDFHLRPRKQFLADQCAMNALFHHNPEKLRLLPCEWNLRSWGMVECIEKPCYCPRLKSRGGCALLHGQGRSFVPFKRNVGFFTVWKTFLDVDWRSVEEKRSSLIIDEIRYNLANISEQAAQWDQSGLSVLRECI